MLKRAKLPAPSQPSLERAGIERPSSPVSVFAEDFALLLRAPRRLRRGREAIRTTVLN